MSEKQKRWDMLWEQCIKNLEKGVSPINTLFLQNYNVSPDEAYILSKQMAIALKIKTKLEKEHPKILDKYLLEEAMRGF